MTVPMPGMLRQMCWGLVIAFPLLALFGQHWRHAAGGPGTRAVMAVAALFCPAAANKLRAVRVADGADALDRAVLKRTAMQLHMGPGCSVSDKLPAAGPIDCAIAVKGKMRGNGKSM